MADANSTAAVPKVIHSVTFHSYPKLLFVWPLIVLGPLLWFIAGSDVASTPGVTPAPAVTATATTITDGEPSIDRHGRLEVIGWIYLMTVVVIVLTLGVDIERNHAVFWVVAMAMGYFLGLWLRDVQGFTLFGDMYRWFAALDVGYNRSFGLSLSILLGAPYIVMLVNARLQDKWRITHNEFEHVSWGRADDSLARGAKRVRSTYPDILELLLCGAGTLIVYSANGTTELRRIVHVPMLPILRGRINKLLEVTAVTDQTRTLTQDDEEGSLEHHDTPEQDGAGGGSERL